MSSAPDARNGVSSRATPRVTTNTPSALGAPRATMRSPLSYVASSSASAARRRCRSVKPASAAQLSGRSSAAKRWRLSSTAYPAVWWKSFSPSSHTVTHPAGEGDAAADAEHCQTAPHPGCGNAANPHASPGPSSATTRDPDPAPGAPRFAVPVFVVPDDDEKLPPRTAADARASPKGRGRLEPARASRG